MSGDTNNHWSKGRENLNAQKMNKPQKAWGNSGDSWNPVKGGTDTKLGKNTKGTKGGKFLKVVLCLVVLIVIIKALF